MNDECRMMNAEWGEGRGESGEGRLAVRPSTSFIIHHSSFIIHAPGFSLLEVLISMFILAIGLLGVAALIPVGKLALVETDKSDRGGGCGRSGLCEVEARRMLNTDTTKARPTSDRSAGVRRRLGGGPFVIDPLAATTTPNNAER